MRQRAIAAIGTCGTVDRIAGSEPPPESSPPPSPGETAETELPRSPDAARHARAFVERRFGPRVADSVVVDAKLVATELVSNAVIHGQGRITLRAELRDDAARIEVIDEGSGGAPRIREEAEGDGPGGRGLRIIDALSVRWGTFEGTTHVWADIPLAPHGAD